MPPNCAITIAMSASVTVSIAAESIGVLSVISRVTRLLGSAIEGTISDSAGTSRTSSKVRPRRMSMGCALPMLAGIVRARITAPGAKR